MEFFLVEKSRLRIRAAPRDGSASSSLSPLPGNGSGSLLLTPLVNELALRTGCFAFGASSAAGAKQDNVGKDSCFAK